MTGRQRASLITSAVVAAAAVATLIALLGHGGTRVNVGFAAVSVLLGLALAVVGALLLAQPTPNRLGPLLVMTGAAVVVEFLLREYAYTGSVTHRGTVPLAVAAGWLGLALDPLFFPVPLALVLLLFPDGRLGSRRWRPVVAVVCAVTAVRVVLLLVRRGPLADETYGYQIAWRGLLPVQPAVDLLAAVSVPFLLVCAVELIVRYRREAPDERQRLKPLAVAAGFAAVAVLLQAVPTLRPAGVALFVATVTVGLPAALAVGALRYRVWELDRAVVAALAYGALAVLVTAGYLGVVIGFAELAGSRLPVRALLPATLAAAAVAVVFAPLRDRLVRVARRLVYGVRADPYEALTALPHRLAEAPAADAVLPRTADAVALGLGVPLARVRVRLADGSQRTAWSTGAVPGDSVADLVVLPVRQLGAVIGDIAVRPRPDRPLSRADRRLLEDLAAQAGTALSAVALTAELRASRQRLATAGVAERRRLERDLHDGAQQRLVALAVQLGQAETLAAADPSVAAALTTCRQTLAVCVDELRELARGVYPPVLAARGLAAALRARLRLGPGHARMETGPDIDGARFSPEIELEVYFCCLEALQNATKHCPEATVTVRLEYSGSVLSFSVQDDGPGFEVAAAVGGTGLLSMADRIGAVGGMLRIDSVPGTGTTVSGRVAVQ